MGPQAIPYGQLLHTLPGVPLLLVEPFRVDVLRLRWESDLPVSLFDPHVSVKSALAETGPSLHCKMTLIQS